MPETRSSKNPVNSARHHGRIDPQSAPLDDLLDCVQRESIRYFWDAAHHSSGCAYDRRLTRREARTDLISIGGTGFGALAVVVGVHRGWIDRAQACARLLVMLDHLERVPRFHGAFPHFINGATCEAIPFSRFDDGGDLVETALLLQGLLCARQFFGASSKGERELRERITALYDAVEWDWYTRGGDASLYWHWSPNHQWHQNTPICGWNEGLIAYVLAAGSKHHAIPSSTFHQGWARSGHIQNGNSYHGHILPLGAPFGGPLFQSHYPFCTLDPRKLRDRYASYWDQVVAHAKINHEHCVTNPNQHAGYDGACWGLTSSHGPTAYIASCPVNDFGIIAPTAALSSFPFLPAESEAALRFFFSYQGGKLWGPYGFVDAFAPDGSWTAKTYLAINQGPTIAMIENHRSGLLWQLSMQSPEIKRGLSRLEIEWDSSE